ncbi:MAG: thermonuclease family protein [Cyanobacteria bacterium P01_C01_bin.89]
MNVKDMRGLAIAVLATGLIACESDQEERSPQAQVSQVIDGNTLEVQRLDRPGAVPETVRMLGIDAPRLEQDPWGPESRRVLGQLLVGQEVRLEFANPPRDRYNRLLAYVWQGDRLINEALVQDGLALVSQQANGSPYEQKLRHAQGEARTLQRGIWNPSQPMRTAPDQFRLNSVP